MFGIDHHAYTVQILSEWSLPKELCGAVRLQNRRGGGNGQPDDPNPQRLAGILRLSGMLSLILTRPEVSLRLVLAATNESELLGIPADRLKALFDAMGDDWQTLGSHLGIATGRAPSWAQVCQNAHCP